MKFTKEEAALALSKAGMGSWARMLHNMSPIMALTTICTENNGGVPASAIVAMCRLVLADQTVTEPSFFMVYREDGNSPTCKHDTASSALAEAKRIGNKSGSATHVLAVVDTYRPHAMPTATEFATHAEEHSPEPSVRKNGLWRIVLPNAVPAIVAVFIDSGVPVIYGHPLYVGPTAHVPSNAKWFPLASDGSDLKDEDMPF